MLPASTAGAAGPVPQIIALYSPSPGAGKSTIATYLTHEYGYRIRPFAASLKRVGMAFLLEFGLDPRDAERFLYHDKHEVIPGLRCTGRHLLETLGTEWARTHIREDIWPTIWDAQRLACPAGSRIVVDDLRRINEAEALQAAGATIWHLHRPGLPAPTHLSTGGELNNWPGFTAHLVNDGSLAQLEASVEALLSHGSSGCATTP